MAENNNEHYELIFKIKVKMPKLLVNSFIFFCLDSVTKNCNFKYALSTLKPNIFENISIDMDWENIKEKIFDISLNHSDSLNQSVTEDITAALNILIENDDMRLQLFDCGKNLNKEKLLQIFKENLSDISDRLELKFEIEKKTEKDSGSTDENTNGETDDKDLFPETDRFIEIQPVKDPVLGKPIKKLKKNDMVILKIVDPEFSEKDKKNLPNYMFGENAASFVEFYRKEGEIYAVFKFDKNVFGRMKVTDKEFKIRMLMDQNYAGPEISFITDNSLLFYLILFGGAGILIVISMIYYNWILG
jgi:hypothetical protein